MESPVTEMEKAGEFSRFGREMMRADFKVKLEMPVRCQIGIAT